MLHLAFSALVTGKVGLFIEVDVDIAIDVLVKNQIWVIFFFQSEIARIHTKYYCTDDFKLLSTRNKCGYLLEIWNI